MKNTPLMFVSCLLIESFHHISGLFLFHIQCVLFTKSALLNILFSLKTFPALAFQN